MQNKPQQIKFLSQFLGWLGAATTGLALFFHGFLGTFSRYYADDFCMSGLVIRHGFWSAQWIQYTTWSNRFTGMFLLSVSDLLGKSFIKYWTFLTIILWVIGLTWTIVNIDKLLHIKMPVWLSILLGEWIILFSILIAPQIYQSLLWRIGLITYTVPLVFLSFLTSLLISGYRRLLEKKSEWGWLLGIGIIAFLGGGLSETYLAFQISLLVLSLLIILILSNNDMRWAAGKPFVSALIGSSLALTIVLASPGNAIRQAAMPAPPALLEFIKMIVINPFLFAYISLKTYAFQMLLVTVGSMMFFYFAGIKISLPIRPSIYILAVLLAPLVTYIILAAVMAPAAYAQSSYPDGRVLIIAAFAVIVFLAIIGCISGMMLNQLHELAGETVPMILRILSAFIALILFCYPLYDANKSFRSIPIYQSYATAWDERDARIKSDVSMGEDQIEEVTLDTPAHLSDISADSSYWVNNCVADYYGLAGITAKP